jgi:hypothetical protein
MSDERTPAAGGGAAGFFWALQCGWFGGCFLGLGVALALGTDFVPTALVCRGCLFALALAGVGLHAAGARGLGCWLVGLVTVAVLVGVVIVLCLQIEADSLKDRGPAGQHDDSSWQSPRLPTFVEGCLAAARLSREDGRLFLSAAFLGGGRNRARSRRGRRLRGARAGPGACVPPATRPPPAT